MATPITFCILCLFLCSMVNANIEGDALIAFKQSLSDPNNALYSWDCTFVNPCTWLFVACNGDTQVTHLEMPGRNLSGQLVPQLGDLQHLQYMALENNNLQGTIPAELGNLINLVTLDLHNNDLTGPIPPSFGNLKSLKVLRLNDNQGLTGIVPLVVSTLPNLKMLNVTDTDIVGGPPNPGTPKTIPSNSMATPLGHFKLFFLFPIVVAILF